METHRQTASSVARNREPILDVLRSILPKQGVALEIASGSGEHIVYLAAHFPELVFCPSDIDQGARQSIAAWTQTSGLKNVRAPLALDAASADWPLERADAILCINMIHISIWAATEGLFKGANRILAPGAPLYLYGAYKRAGAHTSQSNEEFDAWLRNKNPAWGVRDIEAVVECGAAHGFSEPEIIAMPANNLSLIFRRRDATKA